MELVLGLVEEDVEDVDDDEVHDHNCDCDCCVTYAPDEDHEEDHVGHRVP